MSALADTVRGPFDRLRNQLSARSDRWARRRQGPDTLAALLHRRRIYILPTKSGLLFAAVVLMLLIGSLNYANNMGFVLTFLLTGIGLVAMHQCHRNIANLTVTFKQADPVFAGDPLQFKFLLANTDNLQRSQIAAGFNNPPQVCGDIAANERALFTLPLNTKNRGWLACPRLALSTTYPLGLFRSWAWVHMDLQGLVYPKPAPYMIPVFAADNETGTTGLQLSGADEFSGLREYRRGDPPKSIAWKSAASLGVLLVKEYHEGGRTPLWIDWDLLQQADTGSRLAALCRLLIDADNSQQVYGLRLPGATIAAAKGPAHLHNCLRELALFRMPDYSHD